MAAKRKKAIKEELIKFSFMIPTLIFFSFAVIYPFIKGFHVAFTNWDGIMPKSDFIGLKNFIKAFSDSGVLTPIRVSLTYASIQTIGNNLVALVLALGVVRVYRFNKIHRMIFFMPTALSSVLSVFLWNYIYSDIFTTLFNSNNFLGNPKTVIPAAAVITIWGGCGIAMMIYIAAITSVPIELYESATVDGARPINKLFKITLPMIMPSFTINITLTLTASLSSTGLFLVATGGGPGGTSESIGLYIYNHLFNYNKAGYGQALAYLFLIFVVTIGILLTNLFRKREVEL